MTRDGSSRNKLSNQNSRVLSNGFSRSEPKKVYLDRFGNKLPMKELNREEIPGDGDDSPKISVVVS